MRMVLSTRSACGGTVMKGNSTRTNGPPARRTRSSEKSGSGVSSITSAPRASLSSGNSPASSSVRRDHPASSSASRLSSDSFDLVSEPWTCGVATSVRTPESNIAWSPARDSAMSWAPSSTPGIRWLWKSVSAMLHLPILRLGRRQGSHRERAGAEEADVLRERCVVVERIVRQRNEDPRHNRGERGHRELPRQRVVVPARTQGGAEPGHDRDRKERRADQAGVDQESQVLVVDDAAHPALEGLHEERGRGPEPV